MHTACRRKCLCRNGLRRSDRSIYGTFAGHWPTAKRRDYSGHKLVSHLLWTVRCLTFGHVPPWCRAGKPNKPRPRKSMCDNGLRVVLTGVTMADTMNIRPPLAGLVHFHFLGERMAKNGAVSSLGKLSLDGLTVVYCMIAVLDGMFLRVQQYRSSQSKPFGEPGLRLVTGEKSKNFSITASVMDTDAWEQACDILYAAREQYQGGAAPAGLTIATPAGNALSETVARQGAAINAIGDALGTILSRLDAMSAPAAAAPAAPAARRSRR